MPLIYHSTLVFIDYTVLSGKCSNREHL